MKNQINRILVALIFIACITSCSNQRRDLGFGGSWNMEKKQSSQAGIAVEPTTAETIANTPLNIIESTDLGISKSSVSAVKKMGSKIKYSHGLKHFKQIQSIKRNYKNKLASNERPRWNDFQTIAFILCIIPFLGLMGIHRFYMGYPAMGIIMLLTVGGCGVLWIIDIIRIVTLDLRPSWERDSRNNRNRDHHDPNQI